MIVGDCGLAGKNAEWRKTLNSGNYYGISDFGRAGVG